MGHPIGKLKPMWIVNLIHSEVFLIGGRNILLCPKRFPNLLPIISISAPKIPENEKDTVRLVGGLGNQLHGYAFGRSIAARNNATWEFDCESGFWNDQYNRLFLLEEFPNALVVRKNLPISQLGKIPFKVLLKIGQSLGKLQPLTKRAVVTERQPARYQEDIHVADYRSNPYFLGYWMSYRYYEGIKQELRHELMPPRPKIQSVLDMLDEIQSMQSCSIHWRSYLEEKDVEHPSLIKYYRDAIRIIKERYPNIQFFVFSDNQTAARIELSGLNTDMTFVDLKEASGNLQSLNDFFLIYSCQHAIIGDSTFSWWAAWLSDRKDKTIIAPDGLSTLGDDWLPKHWISISVQRKSQS